MPDNRTMTGKGRRRPFPDSRIVGSRDAGGRHIGSVKNTPQHSVSYGRRTGTGNVCVAMKTEEFERKRGSLPTMPHTLRVDVQFLG